MPHLAAGAHGGLAVKVQGGAGNVEPSPIILDLMADQIDHFDAAAADRLAERASGHRPDVLLELRHRSAIECPVAGIMDPRRDLVDEKGAVVEYEHFHGQHADIAELLRDNR